MEPHNLSWSTTRLHAEFGPEFSGTIRSLANEVEIPETLNVSVSSKGNVKDFELNTDINSSWGNIHSTGTYGYVQSRFNFNNDVSGKAIALGSILDLEWADSCDIEVALSGQASNEMRIAIDGRIVKIGLLGQDIEDIYVKGNLGPDSAIAEIDLRDRHYPAYLKATAGLSDTIDIMAELALDSFALGRLTGGDSLLYTSLNTELSIKYAPEMFSGEFFCDDLRLVNELHAYMSDSLDLSFHSNADSSRVILYSDDLAAHFNSNFDLRQFSVVIDSTLTREFYIDPGQY